MDSLKSLHTFSLPAHCSEVKTIESISSLITSIGDLTAQEPTSEYLILGGGSNTVFVEDYPHPVLLNRILGIEIVESPNDYLLIVGAGEDWHALVEFCMQKGIGGFENLALIPGTVGASPIQNIGAYGIEIEKFIEQVEYLDTTTFTLNTLAKDACQFAYRDSIFKQQTSNKRIITRVFYRLPKHYTLETSYAPLNHLKNPSALDIFNEVIAIRKSKLPDPSVLGNAGSFFKNPVIDPLKFSHIRSRYIDVPHYVQADGNIKIPAAWLIDKLGFKGKHIGAIACHESQPLVLVNRGGGVGKDLLSLAREIRHAIDDTFAIELENEVRLMGEKGRVLL